MDQAMESAIIEAKTKRSRLKASLTTTAKLMATTGKTHRPKLHNELNEIYSKLLNTHYEFCELVESDERYSAYRTVGGLDLDQYLETLETTFTNAIKSYAASIAQDVIKALKQTDSFIFNLGEQVNAQSLYLVQEADAHLSFCKDFSVQCSGIHDFDITVSEQLDESIYKLGQSIYKFRHPPSNPKSVQFNAPISHQSPSLSPDRVSISSHPDLSGGAGGQSEGTTPRLESTRSSINPQTAGPGYDTYDTMLPSHSTRSEGRRSRLDLSVVTAYDSGFSKPVAFPPGTSLTSRNDSDTVTKQPSKFVKVPLPTFAGDRKAWPEFRSVWLMHAQQEYSNDLERAWALKSCLKSEALDCVRAVLVTQPVAYQRMLKRLDNFYCDVSLNVQSVHNELKKLNPVSDSDLLGLVSFVNQVELSYSQLGEVGQINSVTMSQIDQLWDLLPIASRKEWMRVYRHADQQEQLHPFSLFMSFLEEEREDSIRLAERQKRKGSKPVKAHTTELVSKDTLPTTVSDIPSLPRSSGLHSTNGTLCIIHNTSHPTHACKKFLSMNRIDRLDSVKKARVCYRCFGPHPIKKCKSTTICSNCNLNNHHLLLCKKQVESLAYSQETSASSQSNHLVSSMAEKSGSIPALLLIQQVPVVGCSSPATVFFDSGSNGTFITHSAAKRVKAKRLRAVNLDLTTTGNVESQHSTYIYEVNLKLDHQSSTRILCYGLEELTGKISSLDPKVLQELFPAVDPDWLQRKSDRVDLLIGADYSGLHPRKEVATAGEHLKVLEGPFGLCLHGYHPKLKLEGEGESHFTAVNLCAGIHEMSSLNVHCYHLGFSKPTCHSTRTDESLKKFIEGEALGTELAVKCGNCRCGKCPITGHTFSFREEQELELIRKNLQYNTENKRWETKYPWIKDPAELPDNYPAALATLRNTERTLRKDISWAKVYSEQIQDMVNRGVARKLSRMELDTWDGPFFYISHLAVHNPKSSSTPVRIVFNSSQLYKGVSLNSALAKGPDSYLNDLLGVLLRWREGPVAVVGDIRKMYNSVYIGPIEQHCHRFLWRNLEDREPDVYIIQRVNMGDRPAAAISSEAIYKTAELFHQDYPGVSMTLRHSTYVDDIADSVNSKEHALQLAIDTTHVLKEAGFSIKHWLFSGEASPRIDPSKPSEGISDIPFKTQVLGVDWAPVEDKIVFRPKVNFSPKKKGLYTQPDLSVDQVPEQIPLILTRRSVLEQTMRIYDPLGILSPFLLKAKILLRDTWTLKLGWDDPLPTELRSLWVKLFKSMFQMSTIEYDRCLTPQGTRGKPILVLMSDASNLAYGFSAYARWSLEDGTFESRLVFSKCRIAPLRKLSTPQLELNGAVLSKRGRKVLEKEMRLEFDRVYHLVDSETVLCMINKVSTRFKIFEGVRIGEIQAATGGDMSSWYWVKGVWNIADWLTRGKDVRDLGPDSEWWLGPEFLKNPEEQWGIQSYDQCKGNSDNSDILAYTTVISSPEYLLEYSSYSSFTKCVWIIARVQNSIKKRSFSAVGNTKDITPDALKQAKELIVKDVQQIITPELLSKRGGKYSRLHPVKDDRGVWIVGTRLLRSNPLSVSPSTLPALVPRDHPCTIMLLRQAHVHSGHRGRDVTLATFRQEYWTSQGSRLARKVVNDCQLCRLRNPKLLSQKMGLLPSERLLPAPPFNSVMVDFFGPYLVRGEVQKRTSHKGYGVLFTDVCSRAVHIEAAFGYDTSSFLLALKRFTSLRGWPTTIFSDPGSQLVGAENELVAMWQSVDKEATYKTCSGHGTRWVFGPADSAWHQGAAESLVKAAKRAIKLSINDQRLSSSELSTVFTEIANLLNERPIGLLPVESSEVGVLTPNSLLIGRPTARNPGGWSTDVGLRGRVRVIDQIVQQFWEGWSRVYAPTLVHQTKWKKRTRNLQPGDVVAVADSNSLRGQYKIAVVKEVFPGIDGVVRRVNIMYKTFKVGERVYEYTGSRGVVVSRSIQRLALLLPEEARDK